jgi:hypothetical protein
MKSRSMVLSAIFILVFSALSLTVFAHEGREVGEYNLVIGWRVEPAYTGLMNGPEVTVSLHSSEEEHEEGEVTPEAEGEHTNASEDEYTEVAGVAGLEDILQIEVIFGPESRILNLRAVRGEPGHYVADLIPTRAGDYSFRVFGTIEGTEVDETFSAADGQFSSVEPIEDIQFP